MAQVLGSSLYICVVKSVCGGGGGGAFNFQVYNVYTCVTRGFKKYPNKDLQCWGEPPSGADPGYVKRGGRDPKGGGRVADITENSPKIT